MSGQSPIERPRRAGLHGAPFEPPGLDGAEAPPERGTLLRRIGAMRRTPFDKVSEIGYRYAVESLRPGAVVRPTGGTT